MSRFQVFKQWAPWALAILMALGLAWSSCGKSRALDALAKQEAIYNEERALNEVQQGVLNYQLEQSALVIKLRSERIAVLEGEAVVLAQQVSAITHALASAQEPPTTAEIEALPIVIYFRARDKMQEERFSLAMEDNLKDHQVIDELKGIIKQKDLSIEVWAKKYEGEHHLRMMGEDLYSSSKKVIARLERGLTTRNILIGLAAGTISYLAVK